METQVTVIGAGPVGLTLAMDLASRGVDVTVVESRSEDEPADAKCNTVAARTMEIFRRLGVADEVRASGLADDFTTDVIYCTAIAGEELTRIRLPSRNERLGNDGRSAPSFLDSEWLTPEPVVRVSQFYLNPILYEHARTFDRITLVPETAFVRYDDSGDGVTASCKKRSGESLTIRSRYLVGCDGASSTVRKQMGVRLLGDAEISKARSSLIRCPAIKDLFSGDPAWMSWVVNPRGSGTMVAIDGDELWLIHRIVSMNRDFESVDRDASIRNVLGVGEDFTWDVVHHQDWTARRMVAARFRDRNVFIAGDAAHIWIPFAGYGMNAGIADCTNLSWMMAAVLNGQAGERLLEAHERERHPITEQVSRLAMGHATPSTAPGCRLPHFWMEDGSSVYDLLGQGYTLLNFSGEKVEDSLANAFEKIGMPLETLDLPGTPEHYAHDYVVARTDQHVAWRGDELPHDPDAFVAHLTCLQPS